MEQQQRSLAFTAAVGLIILAIIVGSIYYLVKFIQARVASSGTPESSVSQIVQAPGSPEGGSVQGEQTNLGGGATIPQASSGQIGNQAPYQAVITGDKKIFTGNNFRISFPKNWGILTCTNSKNIELDPVKTGDLRIVCDTAVKPISMLVDDIDNCNGNNVKIGDFDAMKSKKTEGDYTVYQWCTKTEPVLNITHRVSKNGERATSVNDFSVQIEDMIKNLSFVRAS